ncbi:MAG: response regulator [Acidobacteriota bacterium]
MGKVILVIDESASFRTVVKLALQKAGYGVEEAGDAQQALDQLPTTRPNLIVCDVKLPGADGLSLARQVRSQPAHKATPIIMLTTGSQEARREEGQVAGVRAWVTKPFQPSQLVDVVKRLCP